MQSKLLIKILLITLLFSSCISTESKTKQLDEIDLFKIDRDHISHYLPYIQNVETDCGKLGLRGKVKSLEYTEHDWEYYFSFGEDGRFIETRSNSKGYDPSISHYVYDPKNGRLLRIEGERVDLRYSDGKETKEKRTWVISFEYDEKGRLTDAEYDQSGILLKYYGISYNSDGSIAALGKDSPNGRHYQYSPDGTCAKLTYMEGPDHNDDCHEYVIEYMYNSNRDVETRKTNITTIPPEYATNDKRTFSNYTTNITYEYDRNGNWTKATIQGDQENTKYVQARKIEYYE